MFGAGMHLDNKTRFLLAQQLTKVRTIEDARGIMQKAKKVISQRPKEIATDKGKFYIEAVRKEFGGVGGHGRPLSKHTKNSK
jgi:hypothetical protein